MGDKNQRKINLHHDQINAARNRREEKTQTRLQLFQDRKELAKKKWDDFIEEHNRAVLVFFIGAYLLAAVFIYFFGGILYG